MKFDMGEAWSQAVAMLGANRDLVLVVAGLFFFLPNLALMLMMPDISAQLPMAQAESDPQAALDALMALYQRIWLPLAVLIVLQSVGSLSLLALLRDSTRPTLGEALKLGLIAFLPYLAAQLIFGFGFGLVFVLLVGLLAAISPVLAVVVGLLLVAVLVYVAIKFSLIMPVIGVERIYNPLTALARSWRLTKGNSFRLLLFFFLIALAGVIVISVIQMVLGVVFALFGAQGQLIGNGVVSSLLNGAWAAVMLAVFAATHRQLADGAAPAKA